METFIIDSTFHQDDKIKGNLYVSSGVVIYYEVSSSADISPDVYDKMTQGKIVGILRPQQVGFLYNLVKQTLIPDQKMEESEELGRIKTNSLQTSDGLDGLDTPTYHVYLFSYDKLHDITLSPKQESHQKLMRELEVLQYELVTD